MQVVDHQSNPAHGFEPGPTDYKSVALPLCYAGEELRENDGTAKAGGQGDPNRQRGTERCRSRRIGVGDPARCAL
jgi:hypothetical protein